MARRVAHNTISRRSRNTKKKNNNSKKFLYLGLGVFGIALIGFFIWLLTRTSGYQFQRSDLDKYIEITQNSNLLEDNASVYLDMSDGMNFAYSSSQSKAMLQAIINKLAANQGIKFFELADEKITPVEKSHTELYNYMLNSSNYNRQKAPIQKTLEQIVNNRQPALLLSDFEEYNKSVIHQAAYAKESFIKWLALGYNIIFYKWDFVENGKSKHMFLTVFDDNANRLNSLVETAVKMTDPNIETYVLGSRDFAYPTSTQYLGIFSKWLDFSS